MPAADAMEDGPALAGNDGEGRNAVRTLLASVDAPTAARLPQDAHGHPRKAPEAAAA
ncbi:hypothetical protein [Streptomyces werraensis]|uniref:hypothetical protein n=1 Tax=Streptomyces werraensis TaxID=68284 RepID=UPI001CE235FA